MLKSKEIQLIKKQLEEVEEIKTLNILNEKFKKWKRKTKMILERVLGESSKSYKDFSRLSFWSSRMRMPGSVFPSRSDIKRYEHDLQEAKIILESTLEENELFGERGGVTEKTSSTESIEGVNLKTLHPEIYKKCHTLYEKREYAEAAEKSFKTVKDRLRKLTSHERGSEAFGKGKLHITGAAAPNVDKDFNEAVKFLTMSIDFFKNEKGHTSDAKIKDPVRAYEYLRLSSLAMNLLENTEIKKK